MGVHDRLCLKLASFDVDVPHARCSTFWIETAMASSDQSPVPHCKYTVAVFRFSPDDQRAMEERFRCGSVCHSSYPRGIRRLGGREKGCSFHFLLDAHHGSVYLLCRASAAQKLSGRSHIFCFRPYGKTDAGNSSLCPAAFGLLASAALRASNIRPGNPYERK